jgi:hypothetical protein
VTGAEKRFPEAIWREKRYYHMKNDYKRPSNVKNKTAGNYPPRYEPI